MLFLGLVGKKLADSSFSKASPRKGGETARRYSSVDDVSMSLRARRGSRTMDPSLTSSAESGHCKGRVANSPDGAESTARAGTSCRVETVRLRRRGFLQEVCSILVHCSNSVSLPAAVKVAKKHPSFIRIPVSLRLVSLLRPSLRRSRNECAAEASPRLLTEDRRSGSRWTCRDHPPVGSSAAVRRWSRSHGILSTD